MNYVVLLCLVQLFEMQINILQSIYHLLWYCLFDTSATVVFYGDFTHLQQLVKNERIGNATYVTENGQTFPVSSTHPIDSPNITNIEIEDAVVVIQYPTHSGELLCYLSPIFH